MQLESVHVLATATLALQTQLQTAVTDDAADDEKIAALTVLTVAARLE